MEHSDPQYVRVVRNHLKNVQIFGYSHPVMVVHGRQKIDYGDEADQVEASSC